MSAIVILVVVPVLFALLGLAAARWGVDSRDQRYSVGAMLAPRDGRSPQ